MNNLTIERVEPWTPHPSASPLTERNDDELAVSSNGTRTRAIDSQLCMVVAQNTSQGSCIIDRKGDILAWNEGDEGLIVADVSYEDGYRAWNGGCFTDVNWMQRRPHIYAEYANEENVGSLQS